MKKLMFTIALVAGLVAPPRAAIVGSVLTLTVPGRASSTVSLGTGAGLVVAVWSASRPGGETDIYAAVSRDHGVSFPAPVRVNSIPGDAQVNGEQPPRVTVASRPSAPSAPPLVTVVWTSKNDQGTTILQAKSEDGGRTFSRALVIPEGSAAGNRGWENVTVDTDGRTRVVWLDHREMAAAAGAAHTHPGHDAAAPPKDGVAMAQQSKLYVATLGESGVARVVTAGVCYCCKTAMVTATDNALYLAWRHVFPGNIRDIAFSVSRDGGRTFAPPQRVSNDQWQLDGCPDDGPALDIDIANRLHVAWPTLVNDGPGGKPSIGIFYAQSRDGRTFSSRERLATDGLPHHPQVVVNGDRVFVAWDELKEGRRRIVLASRATDTHTLAFTRTVVADGQGLVYPTLARAGAGVLVAWTSAADQSRIQLARVQ